MAFSAHDLLERARRAAGRCAAAALALVAACATVPEPAPIADSAVARTAPTDRRAGGEAERRLTSVDLNRAAPAPADVDAAPDLSRRAPRSDADDRAASAVPAAVALGRAPLDEKVATATRPAAGPLTIEILSADEVGPGTVRAAIEQANASTDPVRIVSRLAEGTEVVITRALPPLTAAGAVFEAHELLLVGGGPCMRPDGKVGCDGLVVRGGGIRVRELWARGFVFDGIAVRGPAARDVVISDCRCFDNLDDGVGVSDHASGVVVERCVLEGNGFRTKGKGILVFDYAEAELRDNVLRANRDGLTVSKRSVVRAYRNLIIENYDKGLGIAGATLTGSDNEIRRNGIGNMPEMGPPPNADGIRVTIDSNVDLVRTRVLDNGDAGVVVIANTRLSLRGGEISGNLGGGLRVSDTAEVNLDGVALRGNVGLQVEIKGMGAVRGYDASR